MRCFRLAGIFLLSLGLSLHAEEPFDFAKTPGKLPKGVVPREYAVRIAPNLKALTFLGEETIQLEVRQPARELILNAHEIEVASAAVDGEAVAADALKLDPQAQTLTISLPRELPAGAHKLALKFSGKINASGQGLYHAPYTETGSGAKKDMLGTQFEATDARRMFPCWDEPSFRARFQLTAVIPSNWKAFSNMPVEHEATTPAGKEVRFAMTPPMASYLNVLCAGELDSIEKQQGEVLHRVVATKGKAALGQYALASAQQIVGYYNDYFGVPFPLPKLDEIAVPGGFGGAMENWGGITYFESALLYDPETSSSATKKGIYAVVAHEIAHQWFGDLVTMAWWDNLWLNEGFASWMGSKCTAKFNPDWEVWLASDAPRDPTRRRGIPKETAMEGDARSTTHPIQQEIKTEADASGAFDDITYKKGQSFLRMLESFLGEDVFRAGIRQYMAQHQYSNTTTADLWRALGDASGKPVVEIAAEWTQQPGFPLVKVARGTDGKITLTQERFTVNFANPPALQWKIPLTYKVAGTDAPVSLLMSDQTLQLPEVPDARAIKLNVEGTGNYRVQYDDRSWELLLAQLPNMSSPDRVNLLSDTWALVQAERAPLAQYFALIEKLPTRTELAEQEQIITAFGFIDGLVAGQPAQDRFEEYARSVLHPAFAQLGWEARPDESSRATTLRASLVSALALFNDPEIIAGCNERFRAFLKQPKSLSPDLRGPVLNVVGRYADEKTWNELHARGLRATSLEQKQDYFGALAEAQDPQLAQKALALALTDELPTSRALSLVPRVARSGHPELAWKFARAHMPELLKKADALAANSFAPSLFTFFSDEAMVGELKSYAQQKLSPDSAKPVEKAVDEMTFRARFKERLLAQLAQAPALKAARD